METKPSLPEELARLDAQALAKRIRLVSEAEAGFQRIPLLRPTAIVVVAGLIAAEIGILGYQIIKQGSSRVNVLLWVVLLSLATFQFLALHWLQLAMRSLHHFGKLWQMERQEAAEQARSKSKRQ